MRPTYDQLARIFDAVSDSIILMTVDAGALRVASVNAVFCRIMGAEAEQFVGRPLEEVFPPEVAGAPGYATRARYLDGCHRVVREGVVHQFHEHTEVHGRKLSVEITLTPLIEHDQCTQLLSVARVTTEATRALEAYRAQFEHAPEAILTYDLLKRRFVEVNARACELFEATREELHAMTPIDISPELQPDGRRSGDVVIHKMATAREGVASVFEWMHKTRNGRVVPCECRLVRVPGEAPLLRSSIVDISDRKQAEELKRLSAGLMDEKRNADTRTRVKSELVANLSHELRTPLNAIIGFAEILHDGRVGALNDEQRACLADILGSGQHLLGLINGMLDLAKAESGHMEMRPTRTALRPLVAEAMELVRSLADQKSIVVESAFDEALNDVVVDPARLKQVVLNYLSNALKFTDENGRVIVRLRDDGERFCLEVEDTGIGIRADDIPRLFVEFTQLETGLGRRHEGTGLGLALTKRIVELQGGTVGVASVVGMGSRFWARLPKGIAPHGG